MRAWRRCVHFAGRMAGAIAMAAGVAALAACSHPADPWQLANVTGHLPDLDFSLTDDSGRPVTAANFSGQTALQVIAKLGPDARNLRILFISVDPDRDTPAVLHTYVGAFDPQHILGLTGSDSQIESLAKRYRVAYQMEKRNPDGSYDVTHSSAIYVFDAQGHARLLATDNDAPDVIAHDVRRVIDNAG